MYVQCIFAECNILSKYFHVLSDSVLISTLVMISRRFFGDIYKCHRVLYLRGSDSRQHPTLYHAPPRRFTYRRGKSRSRRRRPRRAGERRQAWTCRLVLKVTGRHKSMRLKRQRRTDRTEQRIGGITEVGYMSGWWDRERNREQRERGAGREKDT